jgi:nucleoside-diphosphate-sugar epimerase
MKIVITGGAGFLGSLLARTLLNRGSLIGPGGKSEAIREIILLDHVQAADIEEPRVHSVAGDIGDARVLQQAIGPETGVVFHLAAVVSGEAEADFDLGMRVNLDGTRGVLEACRKLATPPRVVFASSVAVFGVPLPPMVTDATAPTPRASYGTQKLMGELMVADYTRKGFVDGRSLRLPTIVVRPGRPNKAASSFASSVMREPLNGQMAVCPVAATTEVWLLSPQRAIEALIHACNLAPERWGADRSLNLPGITVSVAQMVAALERVAGKEVAARVSFAPDQAIERIVSTWATRFDTARAGALGFTGDADFDTILRAYIDDQGVRIQ